MNSIVDENIKALLANCVVTKRHIYVEVGQERTIDVEDLVTHQHYSLVITADKAIVDRFQCTAQTCDLYNLKSCIGCRCLSGGRPDKTSVVFQILDVKEVSAELSE